MKQSLLKLACSALLGAAIAGSAFTGPARAQTAGSLAVPLIAPTAETAMTAEQVNHRRWRHHHRRYYRHHRPRGGIYFNFGSGRFSLHVPPTHYYPYSRRYHGYPRASRSRHVSWCYARYRSYRHWDNTYQPYHGPRRPCRSPYY